MDQVIRLIPHVVSNAFKQEEERMKIVVQQAQTVTSENKGNAEPQQAVFGEKVGRNDLCPCGSGKKWKKCGELNTEEHQKLMSQK